MKTELLSANHVTMVKVGAMACWLSAITTVGIHAFFHYEAATFEERLMLYQNTTYLVNRWWVMAHCLLVIIGMWAFLLAQWRKAGATAGLGFVFFVIFGVTEIFRQLMVLFYLNGMRQQYLLTEQAETKAFLAQQLDLFGLMSYPLFGLFILAFALGNFFYGLSLRHEKSFGKILSVLLLLWAAGSFAAFGNEFWEISWLSDFLPHYNLWYQPLMRVLLGLWLWRVATGQDQPTY